MPQRDHRWLPVVLAASLLLAGLGRAALPPLSSPRPLHVGERLEYRIRLGPLVVGSATLEIVARRQIGRRSAYEIRYTARSNRLLAAFYPVRDRIICWADTLDFRSHRLQKRIREGTYRESLDLHLDHARGRATPARGAPIEVPTGCHDVFSALLRLRSSRLVSGMRVDVAVILGGAVSMLRVQVAGERRVRVPAGTFSCLDLVPRLGGEGPFRHDGAVIVALSRDERRLPVEVQLRVPVVGSLVVELVEVAASCR